MDDTKPEAEVMMVSDSEQQPTREATGQKALEVTVKAETDLGASMAEDEAFMLSTVVGEETEILQSIRDRIEALHEAFEMKIKYDTVKDKVIDDLHREVRTYRDDFVFKLLRPVFLDLIAMHDDISSIVRHTPVDENGNPELATMVDNLVSFQVTVEEILSRNGIEVYSDPGDELLPGRQRATRMTPTDQPDLHMKLSERVRKGFAYGSRVLRPEMVHVYRYD